MDSKITTNINRNYYIIGGQYETCYYGASDTLRGAKCIATRHAEYWDNWQGWHKPNIYKADDVQVIISRGRITTPDGWEVIVPKPDAVPVC